MAARFGRSQRKLPVQQLVILSICRFAEPISSTSLLPYLPAMVRSFDIPEQDVGKWAGVCAAMFAVCQAIMGVPWGRFSDIYGRKLSIILGLTSTMITTLIWGFSPNLTVAILARAVGGAGNGNVGIIRTTVAEMVPYKELQPSAFSIMPLVWNIGSILGPTIGGTLANTANVQPGDKITNPTFLQRFPYALPNLVSAGFFCVGITTGILFLEETLETLRDRRDVGLRIGDNLKAFWKRFISKEQMILDTGSPSDFSEAAPFIKRSPDIEAGAIVKVTPPSPPSFREVLNRQAVLNLLVYTLLAMHSMAFDQLLPVYLQYPSVFSDDIAVTKPTSGRGFFHFAGGAALSHVTIGLLSTGNGIFGMILQFFIYPRIARRFGVLNCLKVCVCAFPIACFLMPFTALIESPSWQVGACFAIMLFKCLCGIFAFPCSTILLTNSASSARTLGTLNGFATSTSAIGRAAGPALGGSVFSSGVKKGYVVAPWWTLAFVAVIAAIPVFWLVEGSGFGMERVMETADDQRREHEDDHDLDEYGEPSHVSGTDASTLDTRLRKSKEATMEASLDGLGLQDMTELSLMQRKESLDDVESEEHEEAGVGLEKTKVAIDFPPTIDKL